MPFRRYVGGGSATTRLDARSLCYDKTAGALVEISSEFRDKLFIRSLKTEEASASSASMLATPLRHALYSPTALHFSAFYYKP